MGEREKKGGGGGGGGCERERGREREREGGGRERERGLVDPSKPSVCYGMGWFPQGLWTGQCKLILQTSTHCAHNKMRPPCLFGKLYCRLVLYTGYLIHFSEVNVYTLHVTHVHVHVATVWLSYHPFGERVFTITWG